jgi:cold shock CspA family protein
VRDQANSPRSLNAAIFALYRFIDVGLLNEESVAVFELVNVADHLSRLERLHTAGAENYRIESELARVCDSAIGVTLDDIPRDSLLNLLAASAVSAPDLPARRDAAQAARAAGFEIQYKGRPASDWRSFIVIISALSRHLVTIPDDESRWARNISRSVQSWTLRQTAAGALCRKVAAVRYYDTERGFGMLNDGTADGIFFHVTDLEHARLHTPKEGDVLAYDIDYDKDHRRQAKNLDKPPAKPESRRELVESMYGGGFLLSGAIS